MKIQTRPVEVIKKEFVHVYIAEDGTEFKDRRDCLRYEYAQGDISPKARFQLLQVDMPGIEFSNPEYINYFVFLSTQEELNFLYDYLMMNNYSVEYYGNGDSVLEYPGLYGVMTMDGGDSRDTAYIINIENMISQLLIDLNDIGYKNNCLETSAF